MEKPIRQELLEKGVSLTVGDRNKTYGDPKVNLDRYASLLKAYFGHEFTCDDAAIIMVLAKLSRVPASRLHEDNYVDGAVYFAIAGELAQRSQAESSAPSVSDGRPSNRKSRVTFIRRKHISQAERDAHRANARDRKLNGRRGYHRD